MQTSVFRHLARLCQAGLDLIFPPRCAGCHRGGTLLCSACLATMQPLSTAYCQHCCTPLAQPAMPCPSCQSHPLQLHGLRCVNLHRAALRTTIHAFKYQGERRLAEPLGLLLAQAFLHYNLHADALIPLPLHAQREQERGFNQATLLARVCATHLKVPYLEGVIVRQRSTRAQVGLTAQQRRQNVSGAFVLTPDASSRLHVYQKVVIIDDVSTTGATLEACAAPLYQAGIAEVWGLVLARPGTLIQDATETML